MSKNLRRLPGDEIIERIAAQLAQHDRQPVQGVLATALACAPSKTAWARAARRDPFKYARALADLHRTAGFAERKEQVTLKITPEEAARQLVEKHGFEKACLKWQMADLPAAIIEKFDPKVIDGELA